MLAHDTVPVWRVFVVKESFDVLRDFLFSLLLVNGPIDLLLHVVLHLGFHLADDPSYIALSHFLIIKII